VLVTELHPSSVVAVGVSAAGVVVSAAGGVSCDSSAPDIVGMVGIVPIESSYTGRLVALDVD
jgi:hypothetical protein